MKVTSPAFKNNEKIPKKHTADGENVNPELLISDIHSNAKTLVLICDDPDAKRVVGYTWVHWVVFNIPVPIPKREMDKKQRDLFNSIKVKNKIIAEGVDFLYRKEI